MLLRRIYLDQNKWIDLLREANRSPGTERFAQARRVLEQGCSSGELQVPLQAAHYLETWHRRDWKSRHELAKVMRQLSQWNTLAPIQDLLEPEMDRALQRRFGRPAFPRPLKPFGRGVNHAFGSPTGRLRLVESLATEDQPEGPPLAPTAELIELVQSLPEEAYEWFSLAGLEEDMGSVGVDTMTQHRAGTRFASAERSFAEKIELYDLRSRLQDALVLEDLVEILPEINEACYRVMLDPHELLSGGSEGLRAFLEDIPTRAVLLQLRRLRHANPQQPWNQHDLTDVAALSVAVVYCDIVVTERHWVHVLNTSGVARRFNTIVLSDLALLPMTLQIGSSSD